MSYEKNTLRLLWHCVGEMNAKEKQNDQCVLKTILLCRSELACRNIAARKIVLQVDFMNKITNSKFMGN